MKYFKNTVKCGLYLKVLLLLICPNNTIGQVLYESLGFLKRKPGAEGGPRVQHLILIRCSL